MANIILLTHWTGGDVYPFIRFGSLLKEEGHEVTLLTHCVYEEEIKKDGLNFIPVDSPEEYEEISRDMHKLADPVGHKEDYLLFFNRYHGRERLLREIKLIESVCTKDSIIISRFRSSISGMIAAEKLGLRYASMILAPNYFSHMEYHNQLLGTELMCEINETRAALALEPIKNWKEWLYSPKTIFCGWPSWYATEDETWPKGAVQIGFFNDRNNNAEKNNDKEVCDFVNRAHIANKKIAIITGGSSSMISSDFYKIAIQACNLAGFYIMIATPHKQYIPDELHENMIWIHNTPLRDIMNMADIIIHHGGMGTINEAVDAALPQIVMPHLTDGPDNADRISSLGIAIKFPPQKWKVEKIANAMREMLQPEILENCKKYQNISQKAYAENIWKNYLANLEVYQLPEQSFVQEKNFTVENIQVKQLTREQMLELARKKRMKKGNNS